LPDTIPIIFFGRGCPTIFVIIGGFTTTLCGTMTLLIFGRGCPTIFVIIGGFTTTFGGFGLPMIVIF
jgi:hypothetical protein